MSIDLKNSIQGQLVTVTGPVGSGKSALLLGLLGELNTPEMDVFHKNSYRPKSNGHRLKYAYVGQTPWLFDGSIKENILFGSKYDPSWFQCVIEACELKQDLAEFRLGLATQVGGGGVSRLSGGQRARVALARAVYQKADVYLFDDALSALDINVAHAVAQKCMIDLLTGKTRVVVTNQPYYLLNADVSYVLVFLSFLLWH